MDNDDNSRPHSKKTCSAILNGAAFKSKRGQSMGSWARQVTYGNHGWEFAPARNIRRRNLARRFHSVILVDKFHAAFMARFVASAARPHDMISSCDFSNSALLHHNAEPIAINLAFFKQVVMMQILVLISQEEIAVFFHSQCVCHLSRIQRNASNQQFEWHRRYLGKRARLYSTRCARKHVRFFLSARVS